MGDRLARCSKGYFEKRPISMLGNPNMGRDCADFFDEVAADQGREQPRIKVCEKCAHCRTVFVKPEPAVETPNKKDSPATINLAHILPRNIMRMVYQFVMGGVKVYIPRDKTKESEQIVAAYRETNNVTETAQRLGMSRDKVRRVIGKEAGDGA